MTEQELTSIILEYLIPEAYQKDTPKPIIAGDIARRLIRAGYRRVKVEDLPLLSDDEIRRIFYKNFGIGGTWDTEKEVVEAQRDLIVKYLEDIEKDMDSDKEKAIKEIQAIIKKGCADGLPYDWCSKCDPLKACWVIEAEDIYNTVIR